MNNSAGIEKAGSPSLLAASIALFLGLMSTYTIPVVIGSLMDGLGISAATAGFLGMMEMATIAITTIIIAPWIASWPWRRLAIIGACTAFVAQIISTLPDTLILITMSRVAVGIGFGCVLAVANAVIATSDDPEVMYGKACAVISVGFSFLLFGLPMAARFGYHRSVFVTIACVVLLSIILLRQLPVRAVDRISKVAESSIAWGRIATLFVAITLLYIGLFGIYSFVERIGVSIGLGEEKIGLYLALSTVAGIAGGAFAGWLGIRVGRVIPLTVGCLLSGMVSVIIATSNGELFYAVGLIMYGAVFVFVVSYLLGASAAIDRSGRVAVATNGYILFASALGPWVFGLIAARSSYSDLGWPALIVCCVAIPVVVPLTYLLDREEQ